ncbi:DUF3160 domain-containing protein [Gloeobacter kilaueensis]|uniref:Negative regulator of septation ring formation n=1 Tax=Gloeobacter kilaueensis (strain ATCC BAA-2537 / CCAP 1431/1 / ULC 316 / JS1) TaxID=1183438 RepID=U5QRK5_GLOK1|nr:DUF3160 domain-containing protein [Gloeobacter kilaueensis]AGY60284.1 negative regulator of septation ring formation [Gloeobacter kilaueensis JS1]
MLRTPFVLLLSAIAALALGGCGQNNSPPPLTDPDTTAAQNVPLNTDPAFGRYEEVTQQVTAKVPPYTVATDLKNLTNYPGPAEASDFDLLPKAKYLLAKNGFVVQPGFEREFFSLYERNRYDYLPNFVTTDSLLHNYHLVFDYLLKKLEQQQLAPALASLNKAMLEAAHEQYETVKGSGWENAARRNLAFFAVAARLIDPEATVPEAASEPVQQELQLIAAQQGIAESPVANLGNGGAEKLREDYSQYTPRGHYESQLLLRRYFQTMLWYGRFSFRLAEADEVRSAALITVALAQKPADWQKIYRTTSFFVGRSDDVGYFQLRPVLEKVYGSELSLSALTSDEGRFNALLSLIKTLAPPQINSIPVFSKDREQASRNFRFMGQRATLDGAIFQRLVEREVPGRLLPKALDIPAAMGSPEALAILTAAGETRYDNYTANLDKLKSYISGLPVATWTQNLSSSWLYALQPLLAIQGNGYPSFMRNPAWQRKDLNTFLASWTELKHDTISYARQGMAGRGDAGSEARDDRGYVEPNPALYSRLAALVGLTESGLDAQELLSAPHKQMLERLSKLVLSLQTIAQKELANTPLTRAEYELIRSYGSQLEHFWLDVNSEQMNGLDQENYLEQNPAALVADGATDPNGSVLQEATGSIYEIFVAVPVDGKLRLAKGGVFSQYEFTRPLGRRLTDSAWRQQVKDGGTPPLAQWLGAYLVIPEKPAATSATGSPVSVPSGAASQPQ